MFVWGTWLLITKSSPLLGTSGGHIYVTRFMHSMKHLVTCTLKCTLIKYTCDFHADNVMKTMNHNVSAIKSICKNFWLVNACRIYDYILRTHWKFDHLKSTLIKIWIMTRCFVFQLPAHYLSTPLLCLTFCVSSFLFLVPFFSLSFAYPFWHYVFILWCNEDNFGHQLDGSLFHFRCYKLSNFYNGLQGSQ